MRVVPYYAVPSMNVLLLELTTCPSLCGSHGVSILYISFEDDKQGGHIRDSTCHAPKQCPFHSSFAKPPSRLTEPKRALQRSPISLLFRSCQALSNGLVTISISSWLK